MLDTSKPAAANTPLSSERPHASQVSWSDAERRLLDQLVNRRRDEIGKAKHATLLRVLLWEEADRHGLDTTEARKPRPRAPRQSRGAAA